MFGLLHHNTPLERRWKTHLKSLDHMKDSASPPPPPTPPPLQFPCHLTNKLFHMQLLDLMRGKILPLCQNLIYFPLILRTPRASPRASRASSIVHHEYLSLVQNAKGCSELYRPRQKEAQTPCSWTTQNIYRI